MSVYLLFVWLAGTTPNDPAKHMHFIGVFDSYAGCEREAQFYQRHLVANADLTCVQRVVQK